MRAIYLFMCGIAVGGFLGGCFAGCSGGGADLPPGQEAALIRLHADILVLEQRAAFSQKDSAAIAKGKDSLCGSSGISKKAYEQAIAEYRRDPESWKAFNQKIITRLEELQKARAIPKDTVKSKGKS